MSDESKGLELPEFEKPDELEGNDASITAPKAEIASAAEPGSIESKVAADLEPVFDIPVNISAVLGKTQLNVNQLLKLAPGSMLELDRKVGEAIDIYVNSRLVARGEVVVADERLGVTMTEIIKADDLGH